MENRTINQMESLELISEMIEKTRRGKTMKKDYNTFLLYGYTAVGLAIADWLLIHFTGQKVYAALWFAMFVPYFLTAFRGKANPSGVTTYLQGMLANIWKVIGSMFGLTVVAIVLSGVLIGEIKFTLMMPLSLLYAGIGTAMTGLVLHERWFVYPPLAGLLIAVYMLLSGVFVNQWNLLFGLAFLFIMVIPAHIVKQKIEA